MSSIQNVIIQNAAPKCSACINGLVLLLYHAVGFVLIAVCSKKMISHTGIYQTPHNVLTEREYEDENYLLSESPQQHFSLMVCFSLLNAIHKKITADRG